MLNTSKYYLRNNLVINKPEDIQKNESLNKYLVDVIRTGSKQEIGEEIESDVKEKRVSISSNKTVNSRVVDKNLNMSQINKNNFKKILHFRNIYAFLANVADQIIQKSNQ
jgi:hypothetical protein